jgi:hypothetical protein
MANSCRGMNSCKGMHTHENGMKKNDLIATPKFKKVMAEYGNGTLKTSSGGQVNGPKQAEAIAASESGQSYNQQTRRQKTADRYGMRGKK